ncbi:hypothetical protein RHMOL_Rhmol05G0094500 [Rhododendron molle]|uniref:Uncharacterized protein n=1 Tax=Rhododendron molle TaxID=49168 RepID=A0ACC0NP61_RHOML|nr:hypothetical protein RHMOL_Rhmol05G0094500 [Rhododendron molle]
MGTSGSQPTMVTSFSQPEAAMGTNRPFNMRAAQANQGVNIRAPPQATHGVNIRAPPQPTHGVNTRANQHHSSTILDCEKLQPRELDMATLFFSALLLETSTFGEVIFVIMGSWLM